MVFEIYHPENGSLNYQCIPGVFTYELVATVEANTIEQAFMYAQNFNDDYAKFRKRSTAVGDIIRRKGDQPHLVRGLGFSVVTEQWIKNIPEPNQLISK